MNANIQNTTDLMNRVTQLETALRFYADERRYLGPNREPIPDDPYSPPSRAYVHDVTKDGGQIARQVLREGEKA